MAMTCDDGCGDAPVREVLMAQERRSLIAHRRAVGHSQESLAAALGVERAPVSRWETGRSEPQPWNRPKLARVLGISTGELDDLLNDSVLDRHHGRPADRLDNAMVRPTATDLVSVAQLREQVADLETDYDS